MKRSIRHCETLTCHQSDLFFPKRTPDLSPYIPDKITFGNSGFSVGWNTVAEFPFHKLWNLDFTPEHNRDGNIDEERADLYRNLFYFNLGQLFDFIHALKQKHRTIEKQFPGIHFLAIAGTNYRFMRFLCNLTGKSENSTVISHFRMESNPKINFSSDQLKKMAAKYYFLINLTELQKSNAVKKKIKASKRIIKQAIAKGEQMCEDYS